MSQTLKALLQYCTVRLIMPEQNESGTGFFVAPDLILTSADVVQSAGMGAIAIHWGRTEKWTHAIIQKVIASSNLALLRCSDIGISPFLLIPLEAAAKSGDELYAYTYEQTQNGFQGIEIAGQCEDFIGNNLLIKLNLKAGYNLSLNSLPLLNVRTGKICGIINSANCSIHNDYSTSHPIISMNERAVSVSVIQSEFSALRQPSQLYREEIDLQTSLPDVAKGRVKEKRENSYLKPSNVDTAEKELLYCNLPPRNNSKFIGRNEELKKLLKYISPNYRQHITIVEGISGVGKTALVLEAAYRCWENRKDEASPHRSIDAPTDTPIFDAIIFTSAKQTYLKPSCLLNQPKTEGILQQIFREIALTLDDPTITRAASNQQLKLVYQRLKAQRTLLIVDNVEALDSQDKQDVLGFLANLPTSTQAIVTTLERVVLFSSIQLNSLSEAESLQLIQQQAVEKAVELSPDQATRIYQRFGGIPTALIYAIGQRAAGYSFKRILNPTLPLPQDIAHFLFKGSVLPLREQPAHKLLMAFAMFQVAPSQNALATVAGLAQDLPAVEVGLTHLKELSLIRKQLAPSSGTLHDVEKRYSMLPTTREYTLAELAAFPEFEANAREQWVKYYQEFVRKQGGQDWQNWRRNYDALAREWENIVAVLYWCAAQDRYEDVRTLWQDVDDYVDLDGDWRTRRYWWKWLAREANRRVDLSTYVRALSERGWTLTLTSQEYQGKAAHELAESWRFRKHADLAVQARLFRYIAAHRMTRKQYAKALTWLDRSERAIQQAKLPERERLRHQVFICYYRAEICYREEKYDLAKSHFYTVLEQGNEIGWQRFVNYAQNWLADIAIVQGDLQKAAYFLETGLTTAQDSKERRRVAHFQASYARLEDALANHAEARKWAKQALEFFIRDGMQEDAEVMQGLLEKLA